MSGDTAVEGKSKGDQRDNGNLMTNRKRGRCRYFAGALEVRIDRQLIEGRSIVGNGLGHPVIVLCVAAMATFSQAGMHYVVAVRIAALGEWPH